MPNADTGGRFVRTHQTLSMRVGKGKATSDVVDGSKKGSGEDETTPSVWKRNMVEREENQRLDSGVWSGSVGWELGDQPVL